MKKHLLPLILAGSLVSPVALSDPPTSSHQVRQPFSQFVHNPCEPAETVQLSGYLHRHVWSMTDANGVRHRVIQYNFQNVSGVGLTTGDRYVASTNEKSTQSYELLDDGDTEVEVHNLLVNRLIRTGAADDLWLYFQVHATYVFSSEDPIKERVSFWTECRG